MAGRRANSGANALHLILQNSNLLEYEPFLLEEGADDVSQLKELDEEEFRQLCLMIGMASKPFHVKRLQKALGRPSSQIYSQKRLGVVGSEYSRPPAPLEKTPGGVAGTHPIDHTPQVMPAPPPTVSQLAPKAPPPGPALSSSTPSQTSRTHDGYQQQHVLQPYQQKKQQQRHEKGATGYRSDAFSPKKDNSTPASSGSDSLTYQHHSQPNAATSPSSSLSRQVFLPHYLQPDSNCRDVSPLVDELTPIQAELGPCPFKPSDWDERRSELVRRYAAIYGQGNSKRKSEELSLHEENINMAAFQLCLRDPTLLVRRDELLILSRKALKDGGYTFQHGISKTKGIPTETTALSPIGTVHKQPFETAVVLDDAGTTFITADISTTLMPLPRNMSREKKLKRVEELEFLISKNKMKQSIKLTALEKARQTNDFSMSHHLQAEIESLGNTLANLQEEYSNMKYRLRRSDRYFEKKHKKIEEELGERLLHGHKSDMTPIEVVPKRIRIAESSDKCSLTQSSNSFYQPATSSHRGVSRKTSAERQCSLHVPQDVENSCSPTNHCTIHDSSASTPLSVVQTYSIVTTAPSSSPSLSHPQPSSPPSHTSSPPALLHAAETTLTSSPPPSSSSSYLNSHPPVVSQVLLHREEEDTPTTHHQDKQKRRDNLSEEDLPSTQLLDNINKLATQAAENLRSLPHF